MATKKAKSSGDASSIQTPELPLTTVVREHPESTPQAAGLADEVIVNAALAAMHPAQRKKGPSNRERRKKIRYFLQVEKGNLLTCFATGLIYPPSLDTARDGRRSQRATDLQSRLPDYLLFTQSFTQDADDKQVLAEIVLTPTECSALEPVGDAFLMQGPLPVSRVAQIWTKSQDTADNLLSSARTYSDILIPASLLSPVPADFPPPRPAPDVSRISKITAQSDIQRKKAKYDRAMGLLAFMRNSERYFAQQTHKYRDLASNYLATLSRLNSDIQPMDPMPENAKAADFYLELLTDRPRDPFFASLLEVITSDGVFDKSTVQAIIASHGRRCDEQTARAANTAFDQLYDDHFKTCIQQLQANSKLWNLTVLAVLYRFRKKDGEDKVTVKQIFPSVIADQKKAEIILAFLGMYYGYTALPKHEEIPSLDPDLATFVGRLHPIKFDIESPLDRNVVETAYRFTFLDPMATTGFNYLPAEPTHKARRATVEPRSKRLRTETFTILSTPVRIVEVIDPVESLTALIRGTYPNGRTTGYFGYFAAGRWPMAIIRLNFTREKGLDIDVDTEEVVRSLSTLMPSELDEAQRCVELDRSLTGKGNRV